MEGNKDLIYSNKISKAEIAYTLKTIGSYIVLIIFWYWISSIYMNFGKTWVTFAVSMIWIAGAFATWRVPEQRDHTIKETKYAIFFYLGFLFLYRIVIQKISGITSGQMSSALNINISAVDGYTISSFLQGILGTISVLTPVGYVIWIGQKLKTYKGRNTKEEEFNKLKGFNKNRRMR